jgi:endonuclease YncB( thermonuclease family)
MHRRTFLTALGATGVAALARAQPTSAQSLSASETIRPLVFDSTASLLDATGAPLTDDSLVAVWAEPTAYNGDEDGNDDAVSYPDETTLPLVTSDDGVVGFGAPIGQDDTDFNYGNEEFLLNILDAETDGPTIVFDEGHGQFYDTDSFSAFIGYAENNGYEVAATTDIAADLTEADVAIITSPADAFSTAERDALAGFVESGGTLLLFDQSDFSNYDATTNLNAIAEAIGAQFRFNDDQVYDPENNLYTNFVPVTSNFNTAFDYFANREGLGFELNPTKTYTVEVVEVTDGDTVDVQFEGGQEAAIRVLGIDTPETGSATNTERAEEWEGIESYDYLETAGNAATAFAEDELSPGDNVDLSFDTNEPVRDEFGRVLGYLTYDADGSGNRETLYNRRVIEAGHARVYDSGLARHDEFLATELDAREAGRNVWSESDPANSEPIRNDPVEELFVPRAATIESTSDDLNGRVPVRAKDTAAIPDAPLVAVDDDAGVALVGSPLVDEAYETAEGYPVDTSGYGNYVFLTHLLSRTAAIVARGPPHAGPPDHAGPPSNRGRGGPPPHAGPPDHAGPPGSDDPDEYGEAPVLIDGGHGQFDASYALSAEDAAYYQRYLEGINIAFEGVNEPATGFGAELLGEAQALLITAPVEAYTDAELDAVRSFRENGGAVVLLGGAVPETARTNLNAIAEALDSDLRLGEGVTDETNNLNDEPSDLVTANFTEQFTLFDAYTGETEYGNERGSPGRSRGGSPNRRLGRSREMSPGR